MMESIVITGVNGFIGRNLVRDLSQVNKHKILGTDITAEDVELRNIDLFEYCRKSFLDADFNQIIPDNATLIHLARTIRPGPNMMDYKKDIEENILGGISLFKNAQAANAKAFIFISSGGTIYGSDLENSDSHNETDNCKPNDFYGLSMLTLENYLRILAKESDIKLIILRLSNPFGPHQQLNRGQGFINVVFENTIFNQVVNLWGEGTSIRDFIYISDVTSAINAAINYTGEQSIFNIGSGEGREIRQVLEDIKHIIDEDLLVIKLPEKESGIKRNVLNIDKANRELNWKPQCEWHEALSKTYNYYLEKYK